MKHSALLTLSLSLIILITITCTKDPAGPDISDDLKPKGTITGYIYDMWNRPLKDVLVSVDADSAVPGVSKETGLFTVGKVMEGTYVLRFTHRDYDNDSSYIVTVEQGVNDTLTDTVRLSYAYYILKGRVIYNTSPVPGAGVSAAGYPLSTLTDETGTYVLDRIPKITSLKLICAKSGLGFNTHSSITGIEDDTTRIGDISLIFKGSTVSGTVYDTSGAPVRNEIVAAVGGGLIDTTNSVGEYVIENIPCNESSVRIYVLTSDSLFYGATSGINVKDTSIVPNVDIHLRPTSDLENGNGMAIQVFDMVIVDTVSAVQLTVYPWTDVHTVIHSFMWSLKGQVSTRNDTTKDALLSLTKNDLNALAGSVGSRNISVGIHARNTEGGLSQIQYFTVMIRTFAPMISAGGSPTEGGTPQDSVSIELNETVYFTAEIDDPFGGIDTIEWDFGDETGKWYSTDGLANVRHAFPKEGNFLSVLRVKDTDGNEARDTVTVEVKQSPLDPPQNISPPDKDTVWTLTDNATLLWHKVPSSQAVLYDVYLDSLNDPAGILYKPDVSDTSLLVTVRKDKTYHWKIVAKSGGNTSTGKTWTFTVKSSDTTNHAPSFTDSTGSMTDTVTIGEGYKDTLHASDPDGDTLSFSFLESPGGMALNNDIITWVPVITDIGVNPVQVQVSDGKGGLDTLNWTVSVKTESPTITDVDGNVYHTVKIGNQVWTVENLRTTKYNDGAAINHVTDGDEWYACTTGTGAYCYHNNTTDTDSIEKFGALYNWHAVNTGKLAPEGWHVPTDADWDTLQNYLIANGYNWDGTTTGNKIAKSMASKTDWMSSSVEGTPGNDMSSNNSSGFSALPGGSRDYDGLFHIQSNDGYWWSATELGASLAWNRNLFYEIDDLLRDNSFEGCGFSVRLVKGSVTIPPTITGDPQPQKVNVGQTATFGVIASGTKPFTYQWQKDSVNISGATDSSYTTPATTMNDNGVKFRCIVTNSVGSDSSAEAVLTVIEITDSVADADGNVYHAVVIGNQVWTIENLRTTKYNDSTDIPHVTDSAVWFNLNTPGFCYYNNTNDADTIAKYGALYNWYAVDTSKLAPEGWHVPTDAEWDTLQNYLIANGYNWDGTTTGNKIAKSMAAKTDWSSSSEEGDVGNDMLSNNSSGFSALPSGHRDGTLGFYGIGYSAHLWSATEGDALGAYTCELSCDSDHLNRDKNNKVLGFSVRLVRD